MHSDIGGEMSNQELEDVASNLDIKLTTTVTYSPHQNGINEINFFDCWFDDVKNDGK